MALRDFRKEFQLPMRVWDAPTRLFHWALAVAFIVSWATAVFDRMGAHLASGFAILALLLFRLAWGIVGSDTARLSRLLVSPAAVGRALAQLRTRSPDTRVGHTEPSGWLAAALLLLLAAQVATGLCSNAPDGIAGPLAAVVGKSASDTLSAVHGWLFAALAVLVLLHLGLVVAYAVAKGQDLVRPMVTGKKRLPAATPAPRMASPVLAAAILLVVVGAVFALAAWS